MRMVMAVGILAVLLGFALPAASFECPVHFTQAQAAIDQATAAMKQLPKGNKMALVHALLDDAKTLLHAAKHNHEKPQGTYDHARAIAKADSAQGYAKAAELMAKR